MSQVENRDSLIKRMNLHLQHARRFISTYRTPQSSVDEDLPLNIADHTYSALYISKELGIPVEESLKRLDEIIELYNQLEPLKPSWAGTYLRGQRYLREMREDLIHPPPPLPKQKPAKKISPELSL